MKTLVPFTVCLLLLGAPGETTQAVSPASTAQAVSAASPVQTAPTALPAPEETGAPPVALPSPQAEGTPPVALPAAELAVLPYTAGGPSPPLGAVPVGARSARPS